MTKEKSLKELLAEFESVVAWFDVENEEFDVDKAIDQYQKGAKLAEAIKTRLERAKNEIEVVNKNEADL
jgi:exodeoxyribonuclease VII small subunit